MNRYIFIVLLALVGISAAAERKDSINVWGKVTDFFTGEAIEHGMLTVFNERDSIVLVDTIHAAKDAYWGTHKYKEPARYEFRLPAGGSYKVRFDVEGYTAEPQELIIPERYHHKYTTEWNKDFKLRKLPREQMLGEAVVKATRIKMVVKGDTVEYNADAFDLAEGSMLDKLIEAMPGMELKENGVITHNGKQVESLLVNGKDFFDGDPKLALENLPAYTVKKVQVYRKDDDGAYLVKDSVKREEMKKLVLDVKLKKEYSQGWMVNTDLAGGTAGRYTTKLVGMYFSDNYKFLVAGGMNNLNDRGLANLSGDINSSTSPQGLHNIKRAQIAAQYNKQNKIQSHVQLNATHANDDNESMVSSTTLLTGGDTYSRSHSLSTASSTQIELTSRFNMFNRDSYIFSQPIRIYHDRSRTRSANRSATFNDDPRDSYRGAAIDSAFLPLGSARLEEMLINRTLDQTLNDSRHLNATSNASFSFHDPIFGNTMQIGYNIGGHRNDYDQYQHYSLHNKVAGVNDFRNIATFTPRRGYDYMGRATYELPIKKNWTVDLNYTYKQDYDMNNSKRYRLDSLDGWGEDSRHELAQLPDDRDSMLKVMDIRNSYHTTKRNRNNAFAVRTYFKVIDGWNINISMPLNVYNSTAWDNRNNFSQRKVNNLTSLDPYISLNRYKNDHKGKVEQGNLTYSFYHTMRDAGELLDIYDDTNPLFIRETNPWLKNPRSHKFNMNFWFSNKEHVQNYGIFANWQATSNSISNATIYDRATGITTYRPLNISGNWNANFGGNYSRAIDKNDRLQLENSISFAYNHNAAYISDTEDEQTAIMRSVVDNYTIDGRLSLNYSYNKTNIRLEGIANWHIQNGDRPGFNRVSAVDFNYGVRANGPMVWGIEYYTNLKMYSRRGYDNRSMNDDNLIWNIGLSRSFLKGKPLTLRLEVEDALAQRSNVQNTINAQGRTEYWYNSVPRYALLHVAYKFNTMSKKKENKTKND